MVKHSSEKEVSVRLGIGMTVLAIIALGFLSGLVALSVWVLLSDMSLGTSMAIVIGPFLLFYPLLNLCSRLVGWACTLGMKPVE